MTDKRKIIRGSGGPPSPPPPPPPPAAAPVVDVNPAVTAESTKPRIDVSVAILVLC